jgi:hypothetical protein
VNAAIAIYDIAYGHIEVSGQREVHRHQLTSLRSVTFFCLVTL